MWNEFFSLPLFPQSSCAFEPVGEETAGAAVGGCYTCPPAPDAGHARHGYAQCSNCGTTCAAGSSLCPRCGRAMTNLS